MSQTDLAGGHRRIAVAAAERSGPLAWSQQEWISGLPPFDDSLHEDNFLALLPVGGLSPDAVRAAVGDVLERHQNLRSRVPAGPVATGVQLVDSARSRLDEVMVAAAPGDVRAHRDVSRTCFAMAAEWPVKVLMYLEQMRVTDLLLVVDHWAADGWAFKVVCQDLAAALRARSCGQAWTGGAPVEQPVDVALWESATPAGMRQRDRVLEYWRGRLEPLARLLAGGSPRLGVPAPPPPRMYGGPPLRLIASWEGGGRDGRPALFRACRIDSARALGAARRIARRLRIPVSAVFLAAYGAMICAAEQAPSVAVAMLFGNRLTAASKRSVRNAIMRVPIVLPSTASAAFDEAVRTAAAQQFAAHKIAHADPVAVNALTNELFGPLDRTSLVSAKFNYMKASAVGADVPRAGTGRFPDGAPARFDTPRRQGPEYMLIVQESADRAELELRWNDRSGWGPHAEAMLRYLETCLVLGALDASPPSSLEERVDLSRFTQQ